LRERYSAKMVDGPDRRAFEIATSPLGSKAAEFRDIAKLLAFDTLENFLREMRARFPEIGALSPLAQPQVPVRHSARPGAPADPSPTGSLAPRAQRSASR
jgi:hypothetical protein